MKNPINNTVFDTRDLIEYVEYLQSNIVDAYNDQHPDNELSDIDEIEEQASEDFLIEFQFEIEEWNELTCFVNELSGSPDYNYGEGVIHENYWEEYVQDLVTDCGYISKDFPSWIEIDWSKTADNVSVDYITATYQGDTYYIRG